MPGYNKSKYAAPEHKDGETMSNRFVKMPEPCTILIILLLLFIIFQLSLK